MAEQEHRRRTWYLDLGSGEAKTFALKPGHRAWVTHAVLIGRASVAAGRSVRVVIRDKTGDELIGVVLSAERPVAGVASTTVRLDDEVFWLERDEDESADALVRFVGGYVEAVEDGEVVLEEDGDIDGEDQEEVLEEEDDGEVIGSVDDEDEEMVEGTVYEVEESDDDDGISDDDEGEEESDGEFDLSVDHEALMKQLVHHRKRGCSFAAAGRTAGFMRVAAADEENEDGGGERQILVLYRYTRFSAAWSDGSVEASGSTNEHQLRFIAAAAGHGARSLAWAGASLANLIYPGGSSKRLRKLWTSLASQVILPPAPGAARVKVFVDVGILGRANRTQASMSQMCSDLEAMMAQPWPQRFIGMELNLPKPMLCAHDDDTDGEQRPAKRRRVVDAGDSCGVCLELLEGDDLAMWPGCGKPHVFHDRCLEVVIESKPLCPICRRGLYIERKF